MIHAIFSDWNGTLFEYPTAEPENRKIAYSIRNDAKNAVLRGKFWRVADFAKLLKTKKEVEKRLKQYHDGNIHLWKVYEPFNEKILKGRPVTFINSVIDEFARENADKVDGRIIRPIKNAHSDGKKTGILSVSYDYVISRTLEEAGFPDAFDVIVSNILKTDGDKAIGLTFDIYGRKKEVFEKEFFRNKMLGEGLTKDNVLYLGDSEDDEPIADLLAPGNFIVPFFATDEFKQELASKYEAFVPEDESDLDNYFKKR
ncbi:MAG: haloacid dehalogenase-like hydrolase [Candidatus Aenigmatarchaeota archaeon]|nr:MAG: haloacid dehalogenase-like hydrolase [Candidatus Aenigmarchaeota archaeon]